MATQKKQSLPELMAQIAALQAEAEKVKQKEKAEVIGRIKEAISVYDIHSSELYGGTGRSAKQHRAGRVKASPGLIVRYRDAEGQTWSGRGRPPDWFAKAMRKGMHPDELLVSGMKHIGKMVDVAAKKSATKAPQPKTKPAKPARAVRERRQFSPTQKTELVAEHAKRVAAGESWARAAKDMKLTESALRRWYDQFPPQKQAA